MNKALLKYEKILQSFHLNKLHYDQNMKEILDENISLWQIIKSLTNDFFRGEDLQYHCRLQIIIHTFLLFLFSSQISRIPILCRLELIMEFCVVEVAG